MKEKFQLAAKTKLRFSTEKGILSTEQVYSLSLTDLEKEIRSSYKKVKELGGAKDTSTDLDFLTGTDKVSKELAEYQLRFDILKEIYSEKKEEIEQAMDAREKKEKRDNILAILSKKKEASLEEKSIEELEKMAKDLE